MSRYLFISVGRNVGEWAARCIESIASQQGDWHAIVVDDASTDNTAECIAKTVAAQPAHIRERFTVITNDEPMGAMFNQAASWRHPDADGCDFGVFVDIDDFLAHDHVLITLDRYTRGGALVTYGNYEPTPPSATCPAVRPYPSSVLRSGTVREFVRNGGGFRMNHLRCCSMRVLDALTDEDLQDDDGVWWQTGPDSAVMLAAIEMAGTRIAVIREVLLRYNSQNPQSEWRIAAPLVNRNHQQQLNRTPKAMLR